ncbi:NADH-quinone oxidoreductase subunit N [Knoellia subterranea]|uniref:NADH-quinone oxidoreductase subunit N n=1 Tax=Knoellia subterranea KCTC 19937 TaxID=1385521 RepID=A0A0A0JM92_9MICO|nr:proton-conducting transporter membrane subunit [Knoellia subterranea]KGN38263.1 NADH-quinone oxidoreductase subunit N [Knoellia subterranea KCTC 19937]
MTLTMDWGLLLPALLPVAALALILVVEAIAPTARPVLVVLAGFGLVAAAAETIPGLVGDDDPRLTLCTPAPDGRCMWDGGALTSTLQLAILLSTLAVLALISVRRAGVIELVMLLASASGGVAVVAARDLGTWLITLELATLPVIALVAWRDRRAAAHGALTLLTTSLVSFGLLVLGTALWVTATGDPTLTGESLATAWAVPEQRTLAGLATVVLLAGLAFKLSAVPFHAWTPTTLTSGPLPISALLASSSKLAAIGALIVVLAPYDAVVDLSPGPHVVVAALVILTVASMLTGTVMALRQTEVVRLLAWSTVAQAGWILLPLTALTVAGRQAAAVYTLVYAVAGLVAFAAVRAIHGRRVEDGRELTAYTGLFRRDPLTGGALALALLVLAGLPPGVIGLVAKIVALRPAVSAGLWPVAVVAVVAAVLGIAVYVRWFAVLFGEPTIDAPARPAQRRASLGVALIGSAVLVVASALPQLLVGLVS